MNNKALALSILAVIISFIGGFVLANALNRKEMDDLRTENARLRKVQTENAELTLSDEEIQTKINEADQNPGNFDFQKNLALGLYRYSVLKQNAKHLPEVRRLLTRAHELNPRDYETIVSLANVHLDLGQAGNDREAVKKSREFYQKALEIKKDDADVLNDLGLTYFLSSPPEYEKAIAEYKKALQVNPNHEKALENLILANLRLGQAAEAEEVLSRLRKINANNQALPGLEAQLAESKNKQ